MRGAGIGIALMIYQIGPILVPFIHDHKIYDIDIPPKLLGVIPLLGALCVMILPETSVQPLPASIEDAERDKKGSREAKNIDCVLPLGLSNSLINIMNKIIIL